MDIKKNNEYILEKLYSYLNFSDSYITEDMIDEMMTFGVDELQAFKLLFIEALGIKDDYLVKNYVNNIIKFDKIDNYVNNAYYKNISFVSSSLDNWELTYDSYKPYQLFVNDDFKINYNGEIYPQLSFFKEDFKYPLVKQNGITWMSITPNEINTMKEPIEHASGKCLVIGLGLGYFPYMISLKESVSSITIIEKDASIIKLFKDKILPQFSFKEKIEITCDDAYVFLDNLENDIYDYAFYDIWRDVRDGLIHYKRLKPYESKIKNGNVDYWIYKTLKAYIKSEN